LNRGGRASGDAVVEFETESDVREAMKHHRDTMGWLSVLLLFGTCLIYQIYTCWDTNFVHGRFIRVLAVNVNFDKMVHTSCGRVTNGTSLMTLTSHADATGHWTVLLW